MSSYTSQYPDSQLARGTYDVVLPNWILLGPQPVRPADVAFLAEAEGVGAVVTVRFHLHAAPQPRFSTCAS